MGAAPRVTAAPEGSGVPLARREEAQMNARRKALWRWLLGGRAVPASVLALAEGGEAEALLAFLVAPYRDRERMTRAVRLELATARLDEVTMREVLEGPPETLDRLPQLHDELAAAQGRVIESARLLLAMRAAAALRGLAM